MNSGLSTLVLDGIEVNCVIGDYPEERSREQRLVVDVELDVDLAAAAVSDELADTVDYAALAQSVRDVLRAAKCRLIERAASLVLAECLRDGRVREARVVVSKAGAVEGLRGASVRMRGRGAGLA